MHRERTRGLSRRLAVSLTAVALLLTGACGGSGTSSSSGSGTSSGAVPAARKDPALAARLPAAIASAGVVKVGSDIKYAPVEFFDTDGKTPIGLDPDIGKALGEKLGVRFEFTNAPFAGLIAAVQSRRFDIVMSAMSDNKERQAALDFIDYFNVGTSILVRKGNPEKIDTIDDLCGKTVALELGTTQERVASSQQAKCRSEGKGELKVLALEADTDALTQVKNGRAVADLNDFPVAVYNAKTSGGGADFEVVGQPIPAGPYGIGVRKDDTQLRDALQGALKGIIDEGVYDQILKKWNVEQGALKTAAVNGGA